MRVDDMRRHHGVELELDGRESGHPWQFGFEAARSSTGNGDVRIGITQPCPGKCLPQAAHAGSAQAVDQRTGQRNDGFRIADGRRDRR